MKKGRILWVILAVLAVLSLAAIGCKTDSDDSSPAATPEPVPTKGNIKIENTSATYAIKKVQITDVSTNRNIIDETVDIAVKTGSKTYSDISPGKYTVKVVDANNVPATSTQIEIEAGKTITLRYDGYYLYTM
jgi:uncharacterized protein (DUF2141 family)